MAPPAKKTIDPTAAANLTTALDARRTVLETKLVSTYTTADMNELFEIMYLMDTYSTKSTI